MGSLLGRNLAREKSLLLCGWNDAGRVSVVERIAHLDQGAKTAAPTRAWHYTSIRPNPREITAPIFSIGTLNAQGKTN